MHLLSPTAVQDKHGSRPYNGLNFAYSPYRLEFLHLQNLFVQFFLTNSIDGCLTTIHHICLKFLLIISILCLIDKFVALWDKSKSPGLVASGICQEHLQSSYPADFPHLRKARALLGSLEADLKRCCSSVHVVVLLRIVLAPEHTDFVT
mgnify:CR=1 FL=1